VFLCVFVLFFIFPQIVQLVTAASSKVDVVAALRSGNADHVKAAAELMANQCEQGSFAVPKAYAEAGAVAALVVAMATHATHPAVQEQLCRAIKNQAVLNSDNSVWHSLFQSFYNHVCRAEGKGEV
jgi:hypothetical protein